MWAPGSGAHHDGEQEAIACTTRSPPSTSPGATVTTSPPRPSTAASPATPAGAAAGAPVAATPRARPRSTGSGRPPRAPESLGEQPEGWHSPAATVLAARMGLSAVMVGRTGPLGRLLALFGDPRRDERPAVALVSGEGGVGKTRLLQELIGAVPAGTVVLAGAAEPGSLGRPYEVVIKLLGEAVPGATPTDAAGDAAAPADIPGALAARIGPPPARVVFEGLHWADSASV